MRHQSRPSGIVALALFFVFGSIMSGLAALLLLFPGSFLEPLWRLNPRAREGFVVLGAWAVVLMAVVCLACGSAAIGLFRSKRWGYRTALAILSINLCGDMLNTLLAHDWRTLLGLPIGGLMIAYLLRQRPVFR